MSLFKGIRYFLLSDKSKNRTLKEILGFYPRNPALYDQAFTHKSIINEDEDTDKVSNERLEFLGDAILGAIVAEYFFVKYPFKDEGYLTKVRSKLVSRNFLNQLSVDIGLDTFLETSANTSRSRSIFGDAFEALIGAIYLDKGYESCKKFVVEKVIRNYIDVEQLIQTETNFKSKVIEWTQSRKQNYEFKTTTIESSKSRYFKSELSIDGELVAKGEGNSKKRAEQAAAKAFFDQKKIQY
ncbi:MAG: ribonuclease III [Vicingaceae bacterium]